MEKGGRIPNVSRDIKCYTHCILDAMHNFKNGKFDFEFSMMTAEVAPFGIREFIKKALVRCRYISDGIEDRCEAAYLLSKCVYADGPQSLWRRTVNWNS